MWFIGTPVSSRKGRVILCEGIDARDAFAVGFGLAAPSLYTLAYHAREGSSAQAEEHHNAQSDAQTQGVRAEADDSRTNQKTDIAAHGNGRDRCSRNLL